MANRVDTRGHVGRDGQRTADGLTVAPVETVDYGRAGRETTTRGVSQVMNVPTDRVRWGPIWAGLLAAFFTLVVLSRLRQDSESAVVESLSVGYPSSFRRA